MRSNLQLDAFSAAFSFVAGWGNILLVAAAPVPAA